MISTTGHAKRGCLFRRQVRRWRRREAKQSLTSRAHPRHTFGRRSSPISQRLKNHLFVGRFQCAACATLELDELCSPSGCSRTSSADMPLPIPVGRQREVLALPAQGHFVVLGTAGSGKTTLAILRAVYLADRRTAHAGPTLLLTFNTTLVAYLRHLQDFRATGVTVEHYHKFARGYLNARGVMPNNCICSNPQQRLRLVAESIAQERVLHPGHPVLERSTEFLAEEIRFIAQHGFSTADEYVDAVRVGRHAAHIDRASRPVVFELYERYRAQRTAAGKLYDWDDMASAVRRELANDAAPRRYKHVIIDEGQDFSPEMIRSMAAAIPAGGSLTYFGDVAQQIYGHRTSWRSAGLQINRVWQFEENYRNSAEIAALALAISRMPQYQDAQDLVTPVAPVARGPLPTIVRCGTDADQIAFVATEAQRAARGFSVGLLFRDHTDEGRILPRLRNAQLRRLDRELNRWVSGPGIYHGTYHAAKGLEFDVVVLPFLDNARFPDPESVASMGQEAAESEAIRLLYVGATRAKNRLLLCHAGALTALLPADAALYQRVVR